MKENTGKTKYILLGLLANCPQTGYTIKKCIEYEHSHYWQESFGQIYPTLKCLAEEGFAEIEESAEPSDSSNGRGQRIYSITEAGRAELKKWLSEAPNVERIRYEILLKVSFGSNTEPEIILGHLDEFIKRNDKLIKDMNGFLEMFKTLKSQGEDHTYNELTALCGKYLYTAMKDWAQEAEKIILDRKADKNETKNS